MYVLYNINVQIIKISVITIVLVTTFFGIQLVFAQNVTNFTSSMPSNAIRTQNGGWVTPLQTTDQNGKNLTLHYETGVLVTGYANPGPPPDPIFLTDSKGNIDNFFTNHQILLRVDAWPESPDTRTIDVEINMTSDTGFAFDDKKHLIFEPNATHMKQIIWQFIPTKVGNYTVEKFSNGIHTSSTFFSVSDLKSGSNYPVLVSPLRQLKWGIVPENIQCQTNFVLILKSEDGSPACVKSDAAQKLMKKGWAKEIVSSTSITKISQTKNQVISIGNDTYDTIEFQTMTGNTVSLDNVKFTYHGASPLNNNCYPDLTNQTEARDFEMIPGNVSDMNTHQCWPPSNYPLKITNENTMPTDLFSKYSINFFDYNQTIGVGWCHTGSCYLGQTLYLVKSSWDAPVIYDDPVSLLEFHLGTNASVISSGQAIAIDMSTSNKLPKTILVPSEYNYSFKGTGLGPCTYRPFDLAILEGFYGKNNFTQGNKLSLYQPGIYSCPVSIAPQGYKFEPMSNSVVDRCEPFDGCSNTGQIHFHTSFSGSWNNTSFHKFESGVYTIIAGDEWGHFAIQHFVVNNSNGSQ